MYGGPPDNPCCGCELFPIRPYQIIGRLVLGCEDVVADREENCGSMGADLIRFDIANEYACTDSSCSDSSQVEIGQCKSLEDGVWAKYDCYRRM